ncbi:hypothetical protein ELH67_08505 [Rhizobium ruizarguesonis]|uniref:hypothetical protein n=1 Tax=Rhizobium TaxID=379 RepID=UPI0010313C62|nr:MULTISPECIES: hypothetical protein [Rhizobium]NKK36378.1 hypothetical protein [Rhizobium leguminosarum bv. viciae]TAZ94589.1 hypothetical protein ELH67_08505 [Rhizobium ruizarguesonis]
MTGAKESSWKLVIKGLKSKVLASRKELIAQVLKDVGGDAAPIRQARRVLLTMSVEALSGTPRFIDVHGEGEVCLISFADLLEILADPPPTLAEVMRRVTR